MTLFRQLTLYAVLLMVTMFTGSWLANLANVRAFLEEQLDSHAQDTATSLGLSITHAVAGGDLITAETMVNAVFDPGYYRLIRVEDIDGKVVIDRELAVQVEGVPDWFVQMIPLQTPLKSAFLMAGWSQSGAVYVQSHPGFAYMELWETGLRMLVWFASAGVVAILLGTLGLRLLLRPLVRVEQQARAITERKFEIQESVPRTRELRTVVEAMNHMTGRVKAMFQEQASVAERWQQQAFRDPLTDLGNRRYFDTQLQARLNRADSSNAGVLFIIQINDLKGINDSHGYETGDGVVKTLGHMVQEVSEQHPQRILARLTGGDFGLLLPDASLEDAEVLAEKIAERLPELQSHGMVDATNICHIGGVIYRSSCSIGELLGRADEALSQARTAGPNQTAILELQDRGLDAEGKQAWRERLGEILEHGEIRLMLQPVVNLLSPEQLLHQEVFSRVVEQNGQLVSAGAFMPMAERLGLASQLDKLVIGRVLRDLVPTMGGISLAVNLSPTSLKDQEFIDWLLWELRAIPEAGARLIFEFPEFGAVQKLDALKSFAERVREVGQGVALDHYGQSFSNFGYLQSVRPEYVKIDRAYTTELKKQDNDSRFFCASLCGVAHSLGIHTIAEGVETESQAGILREINIDGAQGYLFGKPALSGDQ